jgi:2-polyprenyl-6-methoxyphenol hydroxylase-like FAD-dependent oxidoreductase
MSRTRTVTVVGGGIAGPVTALALRMAGIEATVYEAHPSPADGLGVEIALAPNGVAALDIVGAAEATIAASLPIHRQEMSVGSQKRIALPVLEGVGPLRMILRTDLYRLLLDLAAANGVRVEQGRRLVDVVEGPDSVTAVFADGSEATSDVLVGADGVFSTVRRLIDPAAPGPQYTGMLALDGLASADSGNDAGVMTFAFGRNGYYLYWPAAGGGTTWGVNLPSARALTIAEARAIPAAEWMRRLLETYGEDTPGAELLRTTDPAALHVNGALHIMPPVPHWHRGRMVLVGDAVHAPSNSSGQGASLAIESAVELARCLRDFDDVPEAFAAYERLRRPRVERVAKQAARTNSTKAPGPIGRTLMPILMPIFIRLAMKPEKYLGPTQRHRIDWAAPVR